MKKLCSFFIILLVLLSFIKVGPAKADVVCSANISPTLVANDVSNVDLTFSVDNTGSDSISRITVTSPDSSIWPIGSGSSSDFTFSGGNSDFVYFDGNLDSGSSASVSLNINFSQAPNSSTWLVDAGGTNCSGNLDITVYDSSSNPPVTMSDITISNLSATSATISWTTNQNSTASIDYGTTSGYGSTLTDGTSSTSHSFNITGLSANTRYHFNTKSIGSVNTAQSGDQTFTTAASGTTTTTTVVKTVSPTPTPTPLPDSVKPTVTVSTDFTKPFVKAPTISGTAKDDKGVAKVEYSLDGGKNFLPVSQIASAGKTSTAFSFTPGTLDDGNYDVVVRATDTSGNQGKSKVAILVIDRLPPQASGLLFSFGPQVLNPQDGAITALAAVPFNVTLSAVGGPIDAHISAKNLTTNQMLSFPLAKNSDSGLWRASIKFPKAGKYSLTYVAKDGAGNSANESLNNVVVENSGKIYSSTGGVNKGKISIYYQEPTTHSWVLWDAGPYSQKNPVPVDENGNYNLFLPSGKYYLHIESDGYKSANSSFFELEQASIVNANFSLKPLKLLFQLGPIKLYWPDFSAENVELKNSIEKNNVEQALLGKSIPYFKLDNISSENVLGKPSIISFINTWNPASSEQIAVLNQISKNKNYNTVAIVEGEKVSKVNVWKKLGGYSLPIATDMDATLIPVYNLDSLPTSFFVDRKGVIKKITGGSLTVSEITKILDSLNN